MTDPVIPPAAVEAAAQAAWDSALPTYWQEEGGSWEPMPSWAEAGDTDRIPSLEAMRVGLTAAIPHLRGLVEAQELRLTTSVALKLGRQEAAEEIAVALETFLPDPHPEGHACDDCALMRELAKIARDTGKGESL